jgi:four helix bundle protein
LDWVSVQALQDRTKRLALRVIRMVDHLPRTDAARTIGRQALRSATAVAANYRAACRSRSKAEFSAKIGVVVEEADETVFWLEILGESGIVETKRLGDLVREAGEIRSLMAASHRTARAQAVTRRAHRSLNNSTNQQFNK